MPTMPACTHILPHPGIPGAPEQPPALGKLPWRSAPQVLKLGGLISPGGRRGAGEGWEQGQEMSPVEFSGSQGPSVLFVEFWVLGCTQRRAGLTPGSGGNMWGARAQTRVQGKSLPRCSSLFYASWGSSLLPGQSPRTWPAASSLFSETGATGTPARGTPVCLPRAGEAGGKSHSAGPAGSSRSWSGAGKCRQFPTHLSPDTGSGACSQAIARAQGQCLSS